MNAGKKRQYKSILPPNADPETKKEIAEVLIMKEDIKKEFQMVKEELIENEHVLETKIEELKS